MAHLKNKTIREFNEKDLADRLKQVRSELFKLKLKPLRKDIARILTRMNEMKRK